MQGEFFFMGIAALGVSLAGFAGIIAALDRSPERSAISQWRIRNIVVEGLGITFAGFGTVAVYSVTGDDLELTIRIVCLYFVVFRLVRIVTQGKPGPAWPDESWRKIAIAGDLFNVALLVVIAVFARLGLFQLLFLLQLYSPASIFIRTVQDLTKEPQVED